MSELMPRYSVKLLYHPHPQMGGVAVYIASDVDAKIAQIEQRLAEADRSAKRYEAVARKFIRDYTSIRHYQPDQDTKELEQIILNAQLEAIDATINGVKDAAKT